MANPNCSTATLRTIGWCTTGYRTRFLLGAGKDTTVTLPCRAALARMAAVPTELKNRAKMLRDKRYAVACHEAAHAVICLYLGQNFDCIRLREEPRLTPLGVEGISLGQFIPIDENVRPHEALKEASVDLAGLAFEKLLRPHRTLTVLCLFAQAANDYKGAMEWCRYSLQTVSASADVERFLFKQLFPLVRKQVLEKWSDIAAVGERLARFGKLNQAEVESILARQQKAAKAGK